MLELQRCQGHPITRWDSNDARSLDSLIDEVIEFSDEAKDEIAPHLHDPFLKLRNSITQRNSNGIRSLDSFIDEVIEFSDEAKDEIAPHLHDPFLKLRDVGTPVFPDPPSSISLGN